MVEPTPDTAAIRAALATGGPLLEAATVQGIPVAATLRALCDALDAEVADGLARTTATVNKLTPSHEIDRSAGDGRVAATEPDTSA